MSLYKRIKERREELNMSQDELAIKLGYKSRSSINKIELGKSDIPQTKIKAFAEALSTTPAFLMGWTDDPSEHINKPTINTKELSDDEILNLAAHRTGHEGKLSEEELDRIKLAIKVALAKNNK